MCHRLRSGRCGYSCPQVSAVQTTGPMAMQSLKLFSHTLFAGWRSTHHACTLTFYVSSVAAGNLKLPSAPCPAGDLSPTDSYVIPSWGGVMIYNPPDPAAGVQPPDRPATLVLSSAQLSSAHSSMPALC